jgi:hypothetical protein
MEECVASIHRIRLRKQSALHAGLLLCLLFNPEDGGILFLTRLYDILSKRIELFIVTAVRTSNPKYFFTSIILICHLENDLLGVTVSLFRQSNKEKITADSF